MAENEIVFSVSYSAAGGYEARAVGNPISLRAHTMDELTANVKAAVAHHFGNTVPLPVIRLVESRPRNFTLGSAKGEFTVPEDFNDPLAKEIEDLFW
jgi:hypothetical protein